LSDLFNNLECPEDIFPQLLNKIQPNTSAKFSIAYMFLLIECFLHRLKFFPFFEVFHHFRPKGRCIICCRDTLMNKRKAKPRKRQKKRPRIFLANSISSKPVSLSANTTKIATSLLSLGLSSFRCGQIEILLAQVECTDANDFKEKGGRGTFPGF
jgi:hypothetical protein